MKKAMLLAAALVITAGPAFGQTISQGMTSAQVRTEFGAPATTRVAGDWAYWYYHNGCPRSCGSDDVVFFQNDLVVAAVLRTSRRHYTGPRADEALEARDDGTSAVHSVDAARETPVVHVGRVRVEDDAEPRDGGNVIIVPAPAEAPAAEGTPVPAREGRPGEPSMTVIQRSEAYIVAPGAAADTAGAVSTADAARNAEAADLNGQTSIDRKTERTQEVQQRRPTATERARRNDRKP
jgi:hypothetical protein